MNGSVRLARQAVRAALDTRRQASISNSEPVCVYDLAEKLGVEVKFFRGDSFDGMYANASKTILVPSLRPPGRQAFTCAHELGHWHFGHGTRIEQLQFVNLSYNRQPEERLANLFAAYLLMPPWTVKEAFRRRTWTPATCSSLQAYIVAVQLGVGYATLVEHLHASLSLITPLYAKRLLKTTPKRLRASILGGDRGGHLVIVDRAWTKIPVDLQVGDMAILPKGVTLEGKSVFVVSDHEFGVLVIGRVPGITRAETADGSWSVFLRVSRRDFEGRSVYRHLDDPDVD